MSTIKGNTGLVNVMASYVLQSVILYDKRDCSLLGLSPLAFLVKVFLLENYSLSTLGYLLPLRVQAWLMRRELKCNPQVSAIPESTGLVNAKGN